MTSTQLVPLTHLTILDVTGPDAESFLQAQVPSDVRLINDKMAQLSGWCTAKGRLLTTFVLYPIENGYRLILSKDLCASIARRLKMYVLRLKVTISEHQHEVFGLINPSNHLGTLILPTSSWEITHEAEISTIRLNPMQVLLIGLSNNIQQMTGEISRGSLDAWKRADIEQGFPLVSLATSELYVPQMINLDKLGGVSFKKGCYPGQEIVARTHYLGKVKRHLYRISSPTSLQPGLEIQAESLNGQVCGSVLSSAPDESSGNWLALAVIQEDAISGKLYARSELDSQQPIHVLNLVMPNEKL